MSAVLVSILAPASRRFVLTLAASALLPAVAAAGVLTVAADGSGDFTQISAAVAAAQDGDLILVAPSAGPAYGPFTIDGKGLVVSVAQAGLTAKTQQVAIKNLAAGQSCVLRGLVISAPSSSFIAGVLLSQCAGRVRLEDCTITGCSPTQLGLLGNSGISAVGVADLGVTNCSVAGGKGASSGTNDWDAESGGPGLYLSNATAWVHGSLLHGGNGGNHDDPDLIPGDNYEVGNGAAGALVTANSTLTVARSVLQGGIGGWQIVGASLSLGGPGADVWSSALLRERDTQYLPGAGTKPLHDGTPEISGDPSDVLTLESPSRVLTTDSPRHEFETLHLKVLGEAGDQAFLVLALAPHAQWFTALEGPLLVSPAGATLLVLGAVPGAGSLAVPFAVPSLPAGSEHVEIWLQLAIVARGRTTLENASTVVLLDTGA